MFLYVGRANDPEKRISLAHDSVVKFNEGLEKIKDE